MSHTAPIRMIALDLDGTLLNNQKHVSARNRAALAAAADIGVQIVPCSGRALDSIPQEVLTLPGVRYVVASGGGGAYDLTQDRELLTSPMDLQTVLAVLRLVRSVGAWGECYTGRHSYTPAEEYDDIMAFINQRVKVLLARQPVENIEAWAAEHAESLVKLNLMFRDFDVRARVKAELETWPQVLLSAAGTHNLEVNAAGCGKGDMLRRLGQLLGISTAEMMACGDQLNDLNMLQTVGLPVAMENATAELKPHAAYITATNEQDGVALAIEKFVLGR